MMTIKIVLILILIAILIVILYALGVAFENEYRNNHNGELLFHTWDKWEDVENCSIYGFSDSWQKKLTVQKRYCKKCNKVQYRTCVSKDFRTVKNIFKCLPGNYNN